jgi:signal transduction histidine kinase
MQETPTPAWEDLVLRPEERTAPVETVQPATVAMDSGVVAQPQPASTQPQSLPASYLTHELRAPVTAIRLGLEILQEQVDLRLQPDERQMLALAVKNTARLEGLVNDIMDFSKIMAGRLKAERVACDPRELMRDAVDGMRSMAVAKGVKLAFDDTEPLPRINAEPRRIIQILTNLISNGIKYTPVRGTVTISAKVGTREHAGTIVFKVKDTGRGIPAKDLDKIFDMFIQSGNTKAAEGTGLGLTLARLMVDLHGGRIWAESWREVGATFFFTIPIAREDLRRPIEVYPKEVEVTGLLVSLAKRFNSFLALFV